MIKKLKEIFCKHWWEEDGEPYLINSGMTKMQNIVCIQCGKQKTINVADKHKYRFSNNHEFRKYDTPSKHTIDVRRMKRSGWEVLETLVTSSMYIIVHYRKIGTK